jgi:excisionase family DNA binding protein
MTMQATITPGYVDYKGAERYTGLSRVTLWKATKAGELRVSKVGTAARFKLADLDAFMASQAA